MKKLLIILILAAITLVSCEKEKLICTKTVTVTENGVIISQDVSKVVGVRGSYKESEIEFVNNISTLTITEVDCGCN